MRRFGADAGRSHGCGWRDELDGDEDKLAAATVRGRNSSSASDSAQQELAAAASQRAPAAAAAGARASAWQELQQELLS